MDALAPAAPDALQQAQHHPPLDGAWTGAVAIAQRESVARRLLAAADICAMVFSLFLVIDWIGSDEVLPVTFIGVPVLVLFAKASSLYDRDELFLRPSTLDEIPRLFQLATIVTLAAKLGEHTLFQGRLGTGQALVLWVVLTVALFTARFGARMLVARFAPAERCLVIGDRLVFERLKEKLDDDPVIDLVGSLPFEHMAGDLAAVRAAIVERGVQRVVIAPASGGQHEEAMSLIRAVREMGAHVSVYAGVLEVIASSVEFDHLPGMTLLGVKRLGLTTSSKLLKRGLDIAGASVAVILSAPLMLIIAALIKRDSTGPVFFSQPRVGRRGEVFRIVKFRTMVDGADEMREALAADNRADGVFKIPDDPRITKVGRLLRRTSLDELPQLFNVLRGQMSLVGPRPLVNYEDARVTGFDRRRLDLKPGMTGPWQIAGSARMSLPEMVKIDYLYVAGWSVWTDAKIMLRTARYVIARKGH